MFWVILAKSPEKIEQAAIEIHEELAYQVGFVNPHMRFLICLAGSTNPVPGTELLEIPERSQEDIIEVLQMNWANEVRSWHRPRFLKTAATQ